MIIPLLLVAFVFSVMVFRVAMNDLSWHWTLSGFLALVPIGAVLFAGVFGLIGSALFVGAMYKAASAI